MAAPSIRRFLVSMPGAKLSIGPRYFKIHNLPLEIFKMILTEIVTDDENNDIFSPTDTFHCAQQLSLVCKKWRTVILNTPSVWTSISSSLPEPLLKLSLARSAHAPLAIYLELDEPVDPYDEIDADLDIDADEDIDSCEDINFKLVAPLLCSEIQRTAILYCELNHQRWRFLRDRLQGEAPLLESFMLEYEQYDQLPPLTISQIFNNSRPPRLHTLVLKGCRIIWDSPLLSNLTTLYLVGQDRPSYSQFMAFLRRLPELNDLTLDHGLPTEFPDQVEHDVISLSRLRKVRFQDRAGSCTKFLHLVQFNPSLVRVSVTDYHNGYSELITACAHRLSAHFEEYPMTFLDLESTGVVSAVITGYSSLETDDFGDEVLRITLADSSVGMDPVDLFMPILDILPLTDVESATCNFPLPMSPSWWTDTFSPKLPRLSSLIIESRPDTFFQAFAQAVNATPHADPADPLLLPLPNLEEVHAHFRSPRPSEVTAVIKAYQAAGISLSLTRLRPMTIFDFAKRIPASRSN